MRLTVPEPKIELYKDGFAKHDQLNREETGDKLSDLVERIDDPLVIALDGAWGSGKSFFLKCWVGEHLKRQGNTTQTVYFDAFQHDFLDDPLIALTGEIAERFRDPEAGKQETDQARASARRSKLKKSAWAVSKAAGRIGLSAVTFGATEILSGMGDEIAKSASEEAKAFLSSDAGDDEAEKFWNAHDARIAAMEAFRLALTELTEPDETGHPQRKLVIVIDELDRCRPDYALSLLEIIKHFFNVDGVHFVLGVNLTELQNSVRARYGSGVDAETYLQKFISLYFAIPRRTKPNSKDELWENYFSAQCIALGLSEERETLAIQTKWMLQALVRDHPVSLRDVDRVLSVIALTPEESTQLPPEVSLILAGLAVAKALLPEKYPNLKYEGFDPRSFKECFSLGNISSNEIRPLYQEIWNNAFGLTAQGAILSVDHRGVFARLLRAHGNLTTYINHLADYHLERFKMT
ncbi:KAP family NTPase [Leisingera sp. S132]|uniref:KAP family P-loop NTPase fold protein n=1 Tax=Leisingera sp. S132 TaxID=2867016 RepID=UPI0021A8CC71|nr:KAP family NTPase [Leisingera sp. S132]UWQ78919.1 KAP family NTPase [Leisingera sp. S132]